MGSLRTIIARVIDDRRSLRWKLPWLFVATTLLAVASFGVFAYASARRNALEGSSARLRSALSQVRTVAELGVVNQLTTLRGLAHNEVLARALREDALSDSAARILRSLKGVSDSSVVVELVDAAGIVRQALPPSAMRVPHRETAWPAYATVGPFQQGNGVVLFEATVGVTSKAGLHGWIRIVRQQRNTVSRNMARRLIEGVEFLPGNANGSLLTPDTVIPYPDPVPGEPRRYVRDNQRWLSVSATVPNTPWIYVLEVPERLALAPANALIIPFIVTGVLVALAGAFFGQRVSRRVTGPLAELTSAAESLARGDRDVPFVTTEREDEIGRLARAFSAMAGNVTRARDRLEAEVAARTGELSTTNARLQVLNEELKESEKLAALGRLSGSAGHELRNPLGVMSNVAFLLDQLPEASGQLKKYSSLLREQIRISDRIITDLLDRAKSGLPVRSVTDVDRLIDDVVLRVEVPPTVRVDRNLVKPVPPLLLDDHHLAQILWNLARNAVQAMGPRGGVLTFVVDHDAGRLRIEVRDTGHGLSPSDAERVFEPMYTTKADGIGLGLSVSRAFARANGGDLCVGSSEEGACFVLEMPADVAAADATEVTPVRDAALAAIRPASSAVGPQPPTPAIAPR